MANSFLWKPISIVLEPNAQAVRTFWKRWKMPWKHGIAPKGFRDPVSTVFELVAVPRLVLLDPKGRIKAVDLALRGPRLTSTLSRLLK